MTSTAVNPHDFLDMRDLPGDDERAVAAAVRGFGRDRAAADIARHYEKGTFPRGLIGEMGTLGLFGMHLDGYGCAGMSAVCYGPACMELEACDSGLRSFVSVQGSLAIFPIRVFGSEEQKVRWLPGTATRETIGCFGLTGPDAGRDPARMRTRARRDGGDWVLDGTKMWITNGSIPDMAVIWAQTDDGVCGFLVETASRGFHAHDIPGKMSLRASVTSERVLDDVRVPNEAILPGVVGLRGPLSCLSEACFGILSDVVDAARSRFDTALDCATFRTRFGKPIAGLQLTPRKLADMAVRLNRAYVPALHLSRLTGTSRIEPEQISLDKLDNVCQALSVARCPRSVLGANGIHRRLPDRETHGQPASRLHLRRHRRSTHTYRRAGTHRNRRVPATTEMLSTRRLLGCAP